MMGYTVTKRYPQKIYTLVTALVDWLEWDLAGKSGCILWVYLVEY